MSPFYLAGRSGLQLGIIATFSGRMSAKNTVCNFLVVHLRFRLLLPDLVAIMTTGREWISRPRRCFAYDYVLAAIYNRLMAA